MAFRKILLIILGGIGLIIVSVMLASLIYPSVRGIDDMSAGQTFTLPLAIPPLLEPRNESGEKVFDLVARRGNTQFRPGVETTTAGFNGAYLGPTIRAHRGDRVRMNVTNSLDEPTTVHWHGMHLPAAMDGGPHQIIDAGSTWQPHWTISNEASTLWYHPHFMGRTGPQVYSGLAGLFIIDDANSDALALPRTYGVDDIPVVVQDRKFDALG